MSQDPEAYRSPEVFQRRCEYIHTCLMQPMHANSLIYWSTHVDSQVLTCCFAHRILTQPHDSKLHIYTAVKKETMSRRESQALVGTMYLKHLLWHALWTWHRKAFVSHCKHVKHVAAAVRLHQSQFSVSIASAAVRLQDVWLWAFQSVSPALHPLRMSVNPTTRSYSWPHGSGHSREIGRRTTRSWLDLPGKNRVWYSMAEWNHKKVTMDKTIWINVSGKEWSQPQSTLMSLVSYYIHCNVYS